MIENPQTAHDLREALRRLTKARKALEECPDDGDLVNLANHYEQARAEAGPAFAASGEEFAGAESPHPPKAEQAAPPPAEASPGVPLVQPPGEVVTPDNFERFGPLVSYRGKGESEAVVEATPYAFAEGTAVLTADGEVATAQPSRIVIDREKGELAVIANDEFNGAYEAVEPTSPESEEVEPLPDEQPEGGSTPPAS